MHIFPSSVFLNDNHNNNQSHFLSVFFHIPIYFFKIFINPEKKIISESWPEFVFMNSSQFANLLVRNRRLELNTRTRTEHARFFFPLNCGKLHFHIPIGALVYTGCSLNIVVFFEDFEIFRTLAFICFPRCQCVYTHQRCNRTDRVQKNQNILRKKHNI